METLTSRLPSRMTFTNTCMPEQWHTSSPRSRSLSLPSFSLSLYKAKLWSFSSHRRSPKLKTERRVSCFAMAATVAGYKKEELPPILEATAEPPALFDGTTRLYICYGCPYAQRTWIARNYKGLQDKIKLVPINLQNRPAWYKEKVYSVNKVPSLEHNNEVRGESLDLLKYIDEHFDGPSWSPDDPEKKKFAEELLAFKDSFNRASYRDVCKGRCQCRS